MPSSRILLEAAVASVEDALAAEQAGADRLELGCALELGGLTPSLGLLRQVRLSTRLPLVVLIRPRPGGFVCSEQDLRVMEADLRACADEGADGFAIGALTPSGGVSEPAMSRLVRASARKAIVFHRAFDEAADPFAAMEAMVKLGAKRILTSGQEPTALAGASLIRDLIGKAAERIEILPGAGIRAHNVAEVVRKAGSSQVHGTFRDPATGRLDADEARRVRAVLDGL